MRSKLGSAQGAKATGVVSRGLGSRPGGRVLPWALLLQHFVSCLPVPLAFAAFAVEREVLKESEFAGASSRGGLEHLGAA